jgi:hypothetical protein
LQVLSSSRETGTVGSLSRSLTTRESS